MKKINQFCNHAGISEDQFYGRKIVGGSLYLNSVTSIPEGFNPTIGGSLYLNNNKKYIGSTVTLPIIPKPELRWKTKGAEYISADGILTEIISHKTNIFRVRKIAKKRDRVSYYR